MPFDAVDIDVMAMDERDGVRKWIRLYRKDAEKMIYSKYLEIYNTAPAAREAIPDRLKAYFDNRTEESIGDSDRCPIIQCAAFFDAYSPLTCHEILFGRKYGNELVGAAEFFIRTITKSSEKTKAQIIPILSEKTLQSDNPYYTVRNRILEFGSVRGLTRRELLRPSWFCSPSVNQMAWMFDPNVPLMVKDLTPGQLCGTPDYNILYRYCIELQVSADMLILADYSHIATLDGEPLTEEQRKWLRMYLTATPYAQRAAFCFLCFN